MSKFTDSIERNLKGIEQVNPGITSLCNRCLSAYGMDKEELETALENGEVADEGSFSRQYCECCGSALGGNRYAAHGWLDGITDIEHLIHLEICQDCLMYLANGEEPEERA